LQITIGWTVLVLQRFETIRTGTIFRPIFLLADHE